MKEHHDDQDLRELFHAQRRSDAGGAPSLEQVLARESAPVAPTLGWPRLAAAAALILLCGIVPFALNVSEEPGVVAVSEQWTQLQAWQASTDGLLDCAPAPWDASFEDATDTWMDLESTPESVTQHNTEEVL